MNLSTIKNKSATDTLVIQATAAAFTNSWTTSNSASWQPWRLTNIVCDSGNILQSFTPGTSATFTIPAGTYLSTLQIQSYTAGGYLFIAFRLRDTSNNNTNCRWINSILGGSLAGSANIYKQITGFTTATVTTNMLEYYARGMVDNATLFNDGEYQVFTTLTLEKLNL